MNAQKNVEIYNQTLFGRSGEKLVSIKVVKTKRDKGFYNVIVTELRDKDQKFFLIIKKSTDAKSIDYVSAVRKVEISAGEALLYRYVFFDMDIISRDFDFKLENHKIREFH